MYAASGFGTMTNCGWTGNRIRTMRLNPTLFAFPGRKPKVQALPAGLRESDLRGVERLADRRRLRTGNGKKAKNFRLADFNAAGADNQWKRQHTGDLTRCSLGDYRKFVLTRENYTRDEGDVQRVASSISERRIGRCDAGTGERLREGQT